MKCRIAPTPPNSMPADPPSVCLITPVPTRARFVTDPPMPTCAVLSAVSGLQVKANLTQEAVVGITCAILVVLFGVQSYGTSRVGTLFAPVVLLWFFR